jgi:hypothetical protein
MMCRMAIACSLVVLLGTLPACGQKGVGTAKFEFLVVDENGKPVPNARIGAGGWTGARKDPHAKVFTNKKGEAAFKIKTPIDVSGRATKDGYYETVFAHILPDTGKVEFGRWKPWPIEKTLVLKRKRDPIPMYTRHVWAFVPVLNKPVGFDLEKGDWVAPHGSGMHSDFVFSVASTFRNGRDFHVKMDLGFSNDLDGVQFQEVPTRNERPFGSGLLSKHEAPLDGYRTPGTLQGMRSPDGKKHENVRRNEGVVGYFRIRTKTDPNGKVVSALYGKLYGEIFYDFATEEIIRGDNPMKALVVFTYYLNVDGGRNVEFDPERNLLPGKPQRHCPRFSSTTVTAP